MNIQQEIREGIAVTIIMHFPSTGVMPATNTLGGRDALIIADDVIKFLSSKGCVIKVEGELPENPYPMDYKELPDEFGDEATPEDVYLMASNGFEKGMRHMLKAGYTKTIPLKDEGASD